MPDTKISNETTASTLVGSEFVLGVQSGVNVKIPITLFKAYIDVGKLAYKGNHNLSTNLFPTGSVKQGFQYYVSASSTTLLANDGGTIPVGSTIIAKIDSPSTTDFNDWIIINSQY